MTETRPRLPDALGLSSDPDQGYRPQTDPQAHRDWGLGAGTIPRIVLGGRVSVDTEQLRSCASAMRHCAAELGAACAAIEQASQALDESVEVELYSRTALSGHITPHGDVTYCRNELQRRAGTATSRGRELAGTIDTLARSIDQSADIYDQAETQAQDWAQGGEQSHTRGVTSHSGVGGSSPYPALLLGAGARHSPVHSLQDGRAHSAQGGQPQIWDARGSAQMLALLAGVPLSAASWALPYSTDLLATWGEEGRSFAGVIDLLDATPGVSDAVRAQLAQLITLGWWSAQAGTGREQATIEAQVAHLAEQVRPDLLAALPAQVEVHGRELPTSSLPDMQLLAYALAQQAEKRQQWRAGRVTVEVEKPAVISGIRSPEQIVSYCDTVGERDPADRADSRGIVSLVEATAADGRRSWLVVIPGTRHWTLGERDPQDLLTNLQALAGRPTDMEEGIRQALTAAGAQPGEEISFYGHSQGGMTAANLASLPSMTDTYRVSQLLTAGSPVAFAPLPAGVRALHVESFADAVPALDARPTPRSATRATVLVDTRSQTEEDPYPHGARVYAQALRGADSEPEIRAWMDEGGFTALAAEPGTQMREYIVHLERVPGITARAGSEP